MTLIINDIQNNLLCHYAEHHDYLNVMLSVISLNVITLSVVAPPGTNTLASEY
jgi:hypothetical protein